MTLPASSGLGSVGRRRFAAIVCRHPRRRHTPWPIAARRCRTERRATFHGANRLSGWKTRRCGIPVQRLPARHPRPAYRLRARGFDTVSSTGTITHVCGKSSARDATTMNFHTAIPTGSNAGSMPEEQRASRLSFHDICADVMDADFSIRRLERRRRGQAARPHHHKGRCVRHGPRAEDRNRREYMHLAMGAVPE